MIERLAWVVVFAACANLFIAFNPTSSFWLDETVTAWVVQDSWGEIAERVFKFQAQSPLYYWIAGLFSRLFGMHEWALRIPSWLFGFASAALLYRISRPSLSVPASMAVVLTLLANAEFDRAFLNARPYAAAFFFSLCSIEFLRQWLSNPRWISLILSSFAALTAFYMHYLFAFSLAAILLVVLFTHEQREKLPYASLLMVTLVAFSLTIPGIAHLRRIGQHAVEYSFAPTLSLWKLLGAIVPLEIVIVMVMSSALLFAFCATLRLSPLNTNTAFVRKVFWWIVIPPIVMTVFSLATDHSMLVGRYYLLASAGIALACGILVERINDVKQRYIFCIILGVFSLFMHRWEFENWRAAAKYVNQTASPGSLTLLHSGLREAEHDSWLLDEANQVYLTSPFQVYSILGVVRPIPQYFEDHPQFQLAIISQIEKQSGKIFVVNLRSPREHSSPEWSSVFKGYQAVFAEKGFSMTDYWRDGLLEAAQITRASLPKQQIIN